MKIKDEILDELRKMTPFAEIKERFRSFSGMYEALREFLPELQNAVEKEKKELELTRQQSIEAKEEYGQNENRRQIVWKEVEELEERKEKLAEQVSQEGKRIDEMKRQRDELQQKGFTEDLMKKLKEIEDRSGPNLLQDVKNAERCRQIKESLSALTKDEASLKRQVDALKKKKKNFSESLKTQKNKLDQLKCDTATFKQAVNIILPFLKDGYSTADIQSIKAALDAFEIKGDSIFSIKRLVEGLTKEKSLFALTEKVAEAQTELDRLKEALTIVKGSLKVAQQETLSSIDAARSSGLEAIDQTARRVNNSLDGLAQGFDTKLVELLNQVSGQVRAIAEEARSGLGEWSKLQQKTSELQELIIPAQALLGLMTREDYLETIPLELITQIVERILLWSQMQLSEFSFFPSKTINGQDFNLNTWHLHRLTVLIALVLEGFRQAYSQRNKGR